MEDSEKPHSDHPSDPDAEAALSESEQDRSKQILQITHSLNNHLTAIITNLSLAETDDAVDGELRELLTEAKAAALEASTLSADLESLTDTSEATEIETGSTPQSSAAGPRRILIVDDEKHIRMSLSKIITHLGHHAESAPNSNEAVEQIHNCNKAQTSFDAVILDLTLADGQSAVEVLEQLRRLSPGLKAIVTSGYLEKSEKKQYRDSGIEGLLPKPFTIQDVEQALHDLFSNHR